MKLKLFRCKHCGQIVAIVKETGVPVICCGEPMKEMIAGAEDASVEKHVPVFTEKDGVVSVSVGSEDHPMLPAHYIEWIAMQTKYGEQRKLLSPGMAPKASFCIPEGDELEAIYAFCNLHGLWEG